ncbi:MAG: hypothetical protein E6J61_01530 [Deltaproteobacteria bacterium]|nr:MAG: hypothetical protein E6J61_01530 [Deltaproteobacteria bacterium]
MLRGLLRLAEEELGRTLARICAVAVVSGLAALLLAVAAGMPAAALSALAASWLFFAGLAAGGVALSAAARLAQGRFLESALPLAESPAAFFPAALVLLAVILAAAPRWMPPGAHGSVAGLFVRDFGAAVVLFACGAWFLRDSARSRWTGKDTALSAVVYLLVYAATLSVWAVDLVMALTDSAPSGIVPVQTFMAAFLSAIAWATLFSARRHLDPVVRLDLGRLLYGFAAFWAYLVWCSFLPVWYANLPEEVGEILGRVQGGWAVLSWGVIVATFLVPFVLLLAEAAKRNRLLVGLGATSVLCGLYGERFLLLVRPVSPGGGRWGLVFGALVAGGVAGVFTLVVGARLARSKTERPALTT